MQSVRQLTEIVGTAQAHNDFCDCGPSLEGVKLGWTETLHGFVWRKDHMEKCHGVGGSGSSRYLKMSRFLSIDVDQVKRHRASCLLTLNIKNT